MTQAMRRTSKQLPTHLQERGLCHRLHKTHLPGKLYTLKQCSLQELLLWETWKAVRATRRTKLSTLKEWQTTVHLWKEVKLPLLGKVGLIPTSTTSCCKRRLRRHLRRLLKKALWKRHKLWITSITNKSIQHKGQIKSEINQRARQVPDQGVTNKIVESPSGKETSQTVLHLSQKIAWVTITTFKREKAIIELWTQGMLTVSFKQTDQASTFMSTYQ